MCPFTWVTYVCIRLQCVASIATSAKVSARFLNNGVGCAEGVADDDIGDVGYVTDPLSFEDFSFGQDVPQ